MEKMFHFVNASEVDGRVAGRREMRRHVMMGKNAGKTIHRPSRIAAAKHEASGCQRVGNAHALIRNAGRAERSYRAIIPIAGFRTFPSPVTLTEQYAEVISSFFFHVADRLYPQNLGISREDCNRHWLKLLMSDKHGFYCAVALMHACNALSSHPGETAPVAMQYRSKSLAHVRERLESADALSDSMVDSVISLVTQEQIQNQPVAARVHMDGLARLVELRGGLDSLEASLQLLLKVCKTDILFTLEYGEAPRFYRDRMSRAQSVFKSKSTALDLDAALASVQHHYLDPSLLGVLVDVMSLTSLFNHCQHSLEVDLTSFQEVLVSIFYRLLAFDSVQHRQRVPTVETVYQVGLIIFTMTLQVCGRRTIMKLESITKRLRDTIKTVSLQDEGNLVLWLVMVGGIFMTDDAGTADGTDGEWLTAKIRRMVWAMKLRGWEDARLRVAKYPWIGRLHDRKGRMVWDRIHRPSQR